MICSRVKKFLVPGVGPTIVILMPKFKEFSEYSRCLATAPFSRWNKSESFSVGCKLRILCRPQQCPCLDQFNGNAHFSCSRADVQSQWYWHRVLPLEQPLSSHLDFFFSPYHPEEFLARVHVKPDADMAVTLKFYAHLTLVDKLVEQWWCIPEVVCSIPTQIKDFSTSLGERSSWSC